MAWTCDGDITASPYRQAIDWSESQATGSDLDIYWLITKDFTDDFRDSDLSTAIASGGATLRICTNDDGTGRLSIDIVACVPNATGSNADILIMVEGAGLDDFTSSQKLYAFWGGSGNTQPAAADTWGSEAVYSTAATAFWKMQTDPSGGAPQLSDRTGNGYDGTTSGSMTSGDLVSGLHANAWDFDGTDDVSAHGTSLNPTSFTIVAAVKSDRSIANNSKYWSIAQRGSVYSKGFGLHFYDRATSLDGFEVWTRDSSLTTAKADDAVTGAAINDWHVVAGSYSATYTRLKIYVDGVLENTNNSGANATTSTYTFRIGDDNNSAYAWDGLIDHVLVANDEKSSDWIATYHSNTKSGSTLFSAGTFTDGSGAGATGAELLMLF